MPESPKEIVHEVVEEVKELEHEAELGESPRTPFILVGGMMVLIAVIVGFLLVLAFTAYYVTK
jgi:hypothetical protein